ncbi:MAG: aminotransferase class IV family protein [Pseudorhodobacter sp.]|nr:aminotransferase class IV family protein [Pseudorhodobacter sp.]
MAGSAVEGPFCGTAEPGLKLIETLGWDGAGFARLARHLARLARSAAMLGWGCDETAAATALRAAAPAHPARMRLTLDSAGHLAVAATALPAARARWRLGLADERLASDDPWLRLKSTRRGAYDSARATLAPGLDEVVFLNERGEVCDGTITTLFFDAGAGLCTPPLTSGLLPGVLREELLAQGRCREAVLAGANLPRVRLWVGNSLRGLLPAEWRD